MVLGLLLFAMPTHAQETPDREEPQQADEEVEDPDAKKDNEEEGEEGDKPTPGNFWQATLPGGNYQVALDRIASVSRHKYLLDGAFVVDEVTVDTVGQAIARFYYITPVTSAIPGNSVADLANRGRDMVDKVAKQAGSDLQNMVIKKYPETTHARTIEYRMSSEASLTGLMASVKTSWESGRGRLFNAK